MIDKKRVKKLNNQEYQKGPVLYWMDRDCRAQNNWALLYAQEKAEELESPLLVIYNLEIGFLGGSKHQHEFKVAGLKEVEEDLSKKNIPFKVLMGTNSDKLVSNFIKENKVGYLVKDFSPLKIQREWMKNVAEKISIPAEVVDAHNVVPVWITSDKKEYAARTIRPKLHRILPEFLTEFPNLKTQKIQAPKITKNNWSEILSAENKLEDTGTKPDLYGGASQAKKIFNKFQEEKFNDYAEKRNDPNQDFQSDLSPYLHYGQISAQEIAFEIVKSVRAGIEKILDADRNGAGTKNSAAAFLEELIIRRELSDNFCWFEPNYDSPKCFEKWALESLQNHLKDEREYVYTKKQFETAKTHDPAWNACQMQMIKTGKMHGYMRMYWAKKILEWTKNPADAMEVAIYLNDKYELDGRDPNGYAGIAWSIGGVHDRPWFEREIFGKIRYMNSGGFERKFDLEKYVDTWIR